MRLFTVALGVTILLTISLSACSTGHEQSAVETPDTEADKAAISKMFDEHARSIKEGDLDGLFSLYSDGAVLMPRNEPPIRGEQVRSWLQNFLNEFTYQEYIIHPEEIVVSGNFAFAWFTTEEIFTQPPDGDLIEGGATIMVILKRQSDHSWAWYRVIWNSNAPTTVQ